MLAADPNENRRPEPPVALEPVRRCSGGHFHALHVTERVNDTDSGSVPPSLAVKVSAAEAGSDDDQVAIPTQLQVTLVDRFAPGRVGRLNPRTLATLESRLRLVLDL